MLDFCLPALACVRCPRHRLRCCRRTQTLPGKVEFDYLPENCQAVLMLPVLEASAVVVIGTNRARAFTPKDIAWMKGLCERAALSLRETVAA